MFLQWCHKKNHSEARHHLIFSCFCTQDHTADLKQRIEAQFSELHQFLYQEEKLLQVKLKTEERRELIRLDEHKALLSVEISRLRRAMNDIEEKLREKDPHTLLRVSAKPHVTLTNICRTKATKRHLFSWGGGDLRRNWSVRLLAMGVQTVTPV